LDISGASGNELLTGWLLVEIIGNICDAETERDICSTVRLFPQQYMIIKDTLLRESMKTGGYLKKAVARQLIKIGQAFFSP
jgi:hypothetical protein